MNRAAGSDGDRGLGPPRRAVKRREEAADARQVDEAINPPQQMVLRDVVLDQEIVEQRALRHLLRTHHRRRSFLVGGVNHRRVVASIRPFSTASGQTRHLRTLEVAGAEGSVRCSHLQQRVFGIAADFTEPVAQGNACWRLPNRPFAANARNA